MCCDRPYYSFRIDKEIGKPHANCLSELEDVLRSTALRRTAVHNECAVCATCFAEIGRCEHECQACGAFKQLAVPQPYYCPQCCRTCQRCQQIWRVRRRVSSVVKLCLSCGWFICRPCALVQDY